MHLSNEDYVAKISNATPLQLVIITYELVIQNLEQAMAESDLAQKDAFAYKGQQFLSNLIDSLDFSKEISEQLLPIYLYANKLILQAKVKYSFSHPEEGNELLSEAIKILNILLKGWRHIEKNETSGTGEKVMANSEQLFAGLTYRNGRLEEYVQTNNDRGYKA